LGYLARLFQVQQAVVVCGGTGLYLKALCEGLDEMPAVDSGIAAAANQDYSRYGLTWLQAAVAAEDPEFYKHGEIQNPARLLRALIFKRSTGQSILAYRSNQPKPRPFHLVKVGLDLPREVLYARINQRVAQMMQAGLLEEARALYPLRRHKNLQTVGYAELFDFLDGKSTLPQAIDKIKQHTRNYAKRQMTWFKKDAGIQWFSADDPALLRFPFLK
jgi:tRNA dimethylallyltransferase